MNSLLTRIKTACVYGLLALLFSPMASAHFMVAQHGTLNFVDDGVYMVLSLPMSAFSVEDIDGNGAISMVEFNTQRATVVAMLRRQVNLQDANGAIYLDGLMLAPELDHDAAQEKISQLIVMGRYSLAESMGELKFSTNLFGVSAEEKLLEIKALEKSKNLTQEFRLSPDNTSESLIAQLSANREP
jgi:hypothetical protein